MQDFFGGLFLCFVIALVVGFIGDCGYQRGDLHGKCVMKCLPAQVDTSYIECTCKTVTTP